jgi:hypothetical protein
MYGTLPRSFNSSEISNQRSRRRRILDVRHLNQYATFRLTPAEVGLIMPRQFGADGSNQDLMLDEETLRATRFNSTQLSMSIGDSSEDYESSGSEEKLRSLPSVQKPPPPPPRRKPDSVAPTLSPSSNYSEEKVRSLPTANVYKPLPPLPPSSDNGSSDEPSSDDSVATPRSTRTSASPSTLSSKKLSVTFCENDVIASPSKGSNLFRSMFQKKSVTTKNVAVTTSRLRNSPERQTPLSVTPTPILIPRPMSTGDRRHLPLAKRLSDKLKEPFGNKKC